MSQSSAPSVVRRFCPRLLFALSAAIPLSGQTTDAKKIDGPGANEEALKLSPFVVNSDVDSGYAATDTLAGTRLRTSLRDIAASISVVTPQFLEDTGSRNLQDVLVYTTGTEVAGIGGNFSGSNGGSNPSFEEARNSPIPVNRLRGLAGADTTRNFFPTLIPMDGYNTSGLTINRGANAVLFGLGSPAGIIETSTILPQFRNRNVVAVSGDRYGSMRQNVDFERVLVPNTLSLRLAAANARNQYEQDFSYQNVRRFYGAIEARPFKATTIRFNVEHGSQHQRLPRPNPPIDGLSSWYTYFKPTRAEAYYAPGAPSTAKQNDERLRNLDAALAFTTLLNNPSTFYANPANLSAGGIGAAIPLWANTAANDPVHGGQAIWRMNGVRQTVDARNFAFLSPPTDGKLDPVRNNTFSLNDMILDRSVFDYRKTALYGPNDHSDLDFGAVNAAFEQLFLGGDAGFEAVADKQRSVNDRLANFTGTRGDSLGIDVNQQLTNGDPNPNYGRPVVSGAGSKGRTEAENISYRGTLFLKHDFTKTWPNWFGRMLGRQTITGFYTDQVSKVFNLSGYNAALGPTYQNDIGSGNNIAQRQLNAVVYIGPSLLNTTGMSGVKNLSGVTGTLSWPTTLTSWTVNPATGYQWAQRTDQVYTDDWNYLATGVSATRQQVVTYGDVLQSQWLNGLFVSTLGWRHDDVENFTGSNGINPDTGARFTNLPHTTSQLARSNSLLSTQFALHMPRRWIERMPAHLDVSLYYNDSENFRLTAPRNTIYNQPIDAEGGSTKEWGIGVRAFDGKLNFRLTRYQTFQQNVTDARLIGSSNLLIFVAQAEQTIIQSNTPAQIAAAGYVGFDSPNASQTFKDYMTAWNFRITGTNANETRVATYTAPVGVADTTGAESKGYEFEVTYNPVRNWRITANVSQQEATRGKAAPNEDALFADRFAQYFKPAVINLLNGSYLSGVFAPTNSFLTLRSQVYFNAQVSENQPVQELVKWRANLITNYEFSRSTWLKGFGLGGAARWEDGVVVGYPIIVSPDDPTLLIRDTANAWKTDPSITLDGWLSYSRPIFNDRFKWKLQLNVRNLLNDNLLVTTDVNPVAVGNRKDYTVTHARIGAQRAWSLSSSFDF